MKSITRFVPLVVVFSLLASLFLITPVSAATAGTVELLDPTTGDDKPFTTSPGGDLKVSLEDADLNVGVLQQDIEEDFKKAALAVPAAGLAVGATFFIRVPKFPILDHDGSGGAPNFEDVIISTTTRDVGLAVLSVGAGGGLVTFVNESTTDIAAGTTFTLTYTAADVQTQQVKISSTQDGTGFDLVLKETGANTGIFEATFKTGTSTDTTLGSTATLTSTRTVLTGFILESDIGVDLDGNGSTTSTIQVSATSTVDETTARLDADGDGLTTLSDAGVDLNNDGDVTDTAVATGIDVAGLPDAPARPVLNAATGGIITASYSDDDPSGTRASTATVETTKPLITVKEPGDESATRTQATRLIVEVTDADSGVDEGTISFVIDSPSGVSIVGLLTAAITGGFRAEATLTGVTLGETDIVWHAVAKDDAGNTGESDSDTDTEAFDPHALRVDTLPPTFDVTIAAETGHSWDAGDDVIETDPTAAVRTSLRVIFNEDLDGTTVQATDFTVDGVAPVAAQWFDADGTTADPGRRSVFLTVPEMAANAKPKVALVGDVTDQAGNSVASLDEETAVDGIAPKIIVDPSPLLDDNEVAIDVTSDEPLLTAPFITVNGSKLSVVRVIGPNVFRADYEPSNTPNVYNVEVSVADTVGNVETAGEAATDDDDAITFEIDDAIPDPTTIPADEAGISSRSPFIEINWEAEGAEYGIVAAGTSTTVKAPLPSGAVDMDGHGVVTLTVLTLDGANILGQENKEGDATWVLPTKDLALGDHTLVVNGTDEAGNDLADNFEVTFTVVERDAFEIELTTGWNLISLPGDPEDLAINSVIPLTHPIDTVLTFDPKSAAGWLIARRGDDGKFTGIDTIRKELAYWVRTTRFESLGVNIAPIGGGTAELLPTISLAAGWNLVPVLDVTEAGAGVATTTVAAYFGIVEPTRIYEYNPRQDRFDQVSAIAGVLSLGRGYYVYVEDAETVVP